MINFAFRKGFRNETKVKFDKSIKSQLKTKINAAGYKVSEHVEKLFSTATDLSNDEWEDLRQLVAENFSASTRQLAARILRKSVHAPKHVYKKIKSVISEKDIHSEQDPETENQPNHMSETIKQALIDKNYNKYDKPYMTLMYNNEKRIWDIPDEATTTWIEKTYGTNSEKTRELLSLEPMNVQEKTLAMLQGARGEDLEKIREAIDCILYDINLKTNPQPGRQKDDEARINLIKSSLNKDSLATVEQAANLFQKLQTHYIYKNKSTPTSLQRFGSSAHGVLHANRTKDYVEKIAEFVNKNTKMFSNNLKFTQTEVKLAEYATMYHDAGRKNHYVDVFDETSANRAKKQLQNSLKEDEINTVIDAIKNKDADPTSGKSNIAILLHESDCIDITRLRHGFDCTYMDLYKLLAEKNKTKNAKKLEKFATDLYVKIDTKYLPEPSTKPIVCYDYLVDKITANNFVYEDLGRSVMVYPTFDTLYNLWENEPEKNGTITQWFKQKKQSGVTGYAEDIHLESGTKVDSFSSYFHQNVSEKSAEQQSL